VYELRQFVFSILTRFFFSFMTRTDTHDVIICTHRVVTLFLRYAAMVRPLNEHSGKLKLINDITHLELALSPLVGSNLTSLGDAYKMLRAFKNLLFKETHLILSSSEVNVLPLTVIAHHLFSRFEFSLSYLVFFVPLVRSSFALWYHIY
jgi:hypothetical protein